MTHDIPIFTATRFAPLEVSFVNLGADSEARIRSIPIEDLIMDNEIRDDTQVDTAQVDAVTAERTRCAEIRKIGKTLNQQDLADQLITDGVSLDEARTAMIDRKASTDVHIRPRIESGYDAHDPANQDRAISDCLFAKMSGQEPSAQARPLMSKTVSELRQLTESRSAGTRSTRGWLNRTGGGFHTTSDFPALLLDSGNRLLLSAYDAALPALRQVARQSQGADFRPLQRLRLSLAPSLERVEEHGEITRGSASEATDAYSIASFARIFGLTMQAQKNDDTQAFSDWLTRMGQAAAQREGQELAAVLTGPSGVGPTMGDGLALFSTGHGNIAGSGAAPDETTLNNARVAMRRQKDIDGTTPINVVPRFIVIPPELELAVQKLLTAIQATETSKANPFANSLGIIVEPRLADSNQWYVFSEPSSAPVLEYAYLEGQTGVQLSVKEGWDVLATEFRVVLNFGAGVVGYQGGFLNPGT